MSSAQRKEPRFRVNVPVIVSLGKKTVTIETEDISYRGLYVPLEPDDLPPLRKLIRVELQLHGGTDTFATHAMVVRHGDDYGKIGIGLEFFGRTESADWDRFVRESQATTASAAPPQVQPAPFNPPPGFPQTPPPPFVAQPSPMPIPPFNPGPPAFPPGPPAPPPPPPPISPQPPAPPPQPAHFSPPYPHFAPPPQAPVIHGLGQSSPPDAFNQPTQRQSAPPPPFPPQPPPLPTAASGSAPPPGAERRRHARSPMPIEIRVRTTRSIHVAHGIDASLGGISLCGADLALNIGEQIILNLAQPGTPLSFRVEAMVRRTLPAPHPGTFGYGLEFTQLDEVRQTLLSDFFETAKKAFG